MRSLRGQFRAGEVVMAGLPSPRDASRGSNLAAGASKLWCRPRESNPLALAAVEAIKERTQFESEKVEKDARISDLEARLSRLEKLVDAGRSPAC